MIKGLTGIKKRKDYASYEYANEISPVKYINGNYPEIMVVTGRTDYFTKYQNMSLVEKLKEQGVKYQYLHIKTFLNCFHCFHLKVNMPGARRAMKESVKFLMKDIVKDVKELDSVLTYKEYLAQKR